MTVPLTQLKPTDSSKLYLRPICTPAGVAGPAARVGGAWAGFDLVEVIQRDGASATVARTDLSGLRAWAGGLGTAERRRIEELLARITEPRAAIAGIAMDAPCLMGVLNVTPDSFSDGGDFAAAEDAIARGRALSEAGASILDIGGESTRPGSDPVPAPEEAGRVLPVIAALAGESVISIDSRKASVMAQAVSAGAAIINDISALAGDDGALCLAARLAVPVMLMHCRGEPKTMQVAPAYDHPAGEIFDYLEARIAACEAAGIPRARIAVDPGIGFGKALAHNLAILSHLSLFHGLGCPVLIGVSRKSFIGHISGENAPKKRLPGSLAAMIAGLGQGVQMVRTHDVGETSQALAVWRAIQDGGI
ncbi:MAG: dihydropteroate synthase [Alphaproteobacteria bacterium]|nr:dihydropteroate synthase [Alphaproteobacteria bacterium]